MDNSNGHFPLLVPALKMMKMRTLTSFDDLPFLQMCCYVIIMLPLFLLITYKSDGEMELFFLVIYVEIDLARNIYTLTLVTTIILT